MSFLGGIGTIMGGSGSTETMETIYAQNSVVHMLDGKAYARALRCHFLIESSLQQIILKKMIYEEDSITQNLLIELQQFYNDLIEGTVDYFDNDKHGNEKMEKVILAIEEYKRCLSESRASKLWIQYIYHIGLVKDFIFAERTGNWTLHLVTAKHMLNLFASAGRVNYAKSARLYLQSMDELPESYPWLYDCFKEKGLHAITRSERFWAGVRPNYRASFNEVN